MPAKHPPKGTLKRAVALKSLRGTGLERAVFNVYVRSGKTGGSKVTAYGKFDAYYARYLEFGTSKMEPKPFFRSGFEAKKYAALAALIAYLEARIPKEVEKLRVYKK